MLQLEVSTDWLKHYELRSSEEEIFDFIKKNPLLVYALEIAPGMLQEYFPQPQLTLEYVVDPEIEEFDHLRIGVTSQLDDEEELDRLIEFETERWHYVDAPIRGLIVLNIDYSDEL